MGGHPLGVYTYDLYVDSAGTFAQVMWGRERDENDSPGWGPIVWHVIDVVAADRNDFHGIFVTETSEFGASDIRPCLWVPNGNNLVYYWLDRDGAPLSRRGDIDMGVGTTNVQTGNFHFGLPRVNKQLWKIDGWAEDVDANDHFQFAVYRDGGSRETVGATITSVGYFERFWTQDSNDTARSMIVEVRHTGNDNANGSRLRDVMVRAVALPDVTREWTLLFWVEDNGKTAKKIRSELEAYVGDLKKYTLPDRDTFNGVMGKPRMLRADEINRLTPRNQEPPHYVIAATVREMSSS